jgi:hypothetical protein
MNFDVLTEGIEPGGLRTKSDIRILICYLLTSTGTPLSKEDLIQCTVNNGLANYFEVTDAISDMVAKGIIKISGNNSELCCATETAQQISKQLDSELPPAVRHKALCAAIGLLAKAKREKENRVEITPERNGCRVTCHISGGTTDLMNFSLAVPDNAQAEIVKKNFQDSPETIYRMLLALVTGETGIAADILKNAGKQK